MPIQGNFLIIGNLQKFGSGKKSHPRKQYKPNKSEFILTLREILTSCNTCLTRPISVLPPYFLGTFTVSTR